MNKSLLIGISGSSCSGKTTLTNELIKKLEKSIAISQDAYYFSENSGLLQYLDDLNYYNYESISAINMSLLREDVVKLSTAIVNYNYIILDGFLLYQDKLLTQMLHKKYFLEIDESTCRMRRDGRIYDNQTDPPIYFDKYIWPSFLNYKIFCENNFNDIKYLDGSSHTDNLVNFIKNDIFN